MTRTRSNISVINARERYAEMIQNERLATSAQSEPSAPMDRAHFNEDRPLARSNTTRLRSIAATFKKSTVPLN